MHVHIMGQEMFVLLKIWSALFSWNHRFKIRPFALLPTILGPELAKASVLF